MPHSTSDYELDEPFIFTPPNSARLDVQVLTATLQEEDAEITECRFKIRVPPQVYTRIDREALFNLALEARRPTSAIFDPAQPVQLELALHQELLEALSKGVTSADEALNRLFEWSRSSDPTLFNHPLLSPQNWYALHVKQAVELPQELSGSGNALFSGYSTRWAEAELDALPQPTEAAPVLDTELLDVFCDFFQAQGWPFSKIKIEGRAEAAELMVQGENGSWRCRALINGAMAQCAFYSFVPEKAPADNRLAVVEFITRANCGLFIGNFEMDWASGEVRFKTSLDVNEDALSPALAQNLVEANIALMDMYLSGLRAVMVGKLSAVAAIAQVEG